MEHTDLQSPPPDNAQLVRFLSGESPLSEKLQIQQWESEDPSHSQWILEARKVWDLTANMSDIGHATHIEKPWNIDSMRTRVLNAMASLESTRSIVSDAEAYKSSVPSSSRLSSPPATAKSLSRLNTARVRSYFTYFAAASLVIASGLWISTKGSTGQPAYHESTYTTPAGHHANVTLPDGSTVHLSVGSRLKVPVDFAKGNRILHLDGEAFFTVNHDSDKPFSVIAGSSITKVLGTRFAVRRYDTDSVATVAVQDGKVSVQRLDNKGIEIRDGITVLSAQQQVSVSNTAMSAVLPTTDTRFDFKRIRLVVDGGKLSSVIPDLERWFDVKIQLGDNQVGERQLVLESTGASIEELQMILEQTLSVRVVRKGREITVFVR